MVCGKEGKQPVFVLLGRFLAFFLKYWFVVFRVLLESFTRMLRIAIIQMCCVYRCNTFILVSIVHVYQMNVEVSCKMN